MSWVIFVLVFIIFGYVIYSRKKGVSRLDTTEMNKIITKQMKEIDEKIAGLSQGERLSIPAFLTGLEESKAKHLGDQSYNMVMLIEKLKEEILKKYGSYILPEEAFIENGEMVIWNEYPGCFERHLQRRYKNILFPPERRCVSRKEIEEARKKDEKEQNEFFVKFEEMTSQLKDAGGKDGEVSIDKLAEFHFKRLQSLMKEAAQIGGKAFSMIPELEEVEATMVKQITTAVPSVAENFKLILSQSTQKRIPYVVQVARKDTPILANEQVPALFCEDMPTIAFMGFLSRSFAPDFRPNEADITNHLDYAISRGFSKKNAKEIMAAWHEASAIKPEEVSKNEPVTLTGEQAEIVDKLLNKEIENLSQKMHDTVDKEALQGKTVSVKSVCKITASMSDAEKQGIEDLRQKLLEQYGPTIPVNTAHRMSMELEGNEQMWSRSPGCFERHLQRRDGSFLFSPERRVVTRKEIEEARKKDLIEQKRFEEQADTFITTVQRSGQSATPVQLATMLKKIRALLEAAAAIGNNVGQYYLRLEDIEKTLQQSLDDIIQQMTDETSPDATDETLPQLHSLLKEMLLKSSNRCPYLAQINKDNSPIPEDEHVAALLSEDLITIGIASYMSRSSAPDFRPNDNLVMTHLENAVRQGFSKKRADQIIATWNEAKKISRDDTQ